MDEYGIGGGCCCLLGISRSLDEPGDGYGLHVCQLTVDSEPRKVNVHRAIRISLLLPMGKELLQPIFIVYSQSPIFLRLRVIDPVEVVNILRVE